MMRLGAIMLASLLLCSCAGQRYQLHSDEAPAQPVALEGVAELVPRYEPLSTQGNRDYTVRGQRYQVLSSAEGYRVTGKASWYGAKFHGHLTSNGELYDMYSLSAAHKTLPLPTYLKVTNLDNGLSTVVRVNDRGPFHPERVLDLSYAAAHKLDMLKAGVANVEIEAITVMPAEEQNRITTGQYVQVVVTRDGQRAHALLQELEQQTGQTGIAVEENGVFKVRLGPLSNPVEAARLLEQLRAQSFPGAFMVQGV